MNNRIRELRKKKGLTQVDLAKLLNVSDRTIGFYENEQRDPDTTTLKKLADFFDVTIDYLLGRTDTNDTNKEINKTNSMPDIPAKFTDANLAREYVSKHQIFGANGFEPNKMSDDEILEFANALLEQMELLSYKYKK
ncbi:helix-turn-helix domain-containing protein [Clostridium pasteurianum]|uniref:Putative transcriptional regulator n=2 Tax=Clostridium pasteurianum TaxID=1501 RepID=R4K4G5_CLOPA|nr:helix-turn-helix transcriptional regulator [Clostridium pasteurianum]AGK96601.1 putative transcriptional regulator [Clostridium pasteurianum BC1]